MARELNGSVLPDCWQREAPVPSISDIRKGLDIPVCTLALQPHGLPSRYGLMSGPLSKRPVGDPFPGRAFFSTQLLWSSEPNRLAPLGNLLLL